MLIGIARILTIITTPSGSDVKTANDVGAHQQSSALVVMTEPLLLVVLSPVAATLASRELTVRAPLYSKVRMSAEIADALRLALTVLALAVFSSRSK